MKDITFYLDFISPYAYLAFEALPEALMGLSYSVRYTPVLFAGLLKHHGQLGPAEIAPKRDWTFRQVQWLAHSRGIPLEMPAQPSVQSPGLAAAGAGLQPRGDAAAPNRYVCETIFRHVWRGGAEAADAQRLEALASAAGPAARSGQRSRQGSSWKPIPTTRSSRAFSACRLSPWTTSFSGASTRFAMAARLPAWQPLV